LPVIKMQHAKEPKTALLEKVGDISDIEVFNSMVLIAIYEHDGVTKGGIITGVGTRTESKYQGKVGLILKMGPGVNAGGDARLELRGGLFEVGDWVAVNASDGLSMNAGRHGSDVMLRLLSEASIHIRVKAPDSIW
jgi:co-chaperonin GroES (HSP10)